MADHPLVIDVSLARRLVAERFPDHAGEPVIPVDSSGTDNAIFRLGEAACLRLPRLASAEAQLVKEFDWLGRLALLPLAIPRPLALTGPFGTFPFHTAVYDWLPGTAATQEPPADMIVAAQALAGFIAALRERPCADGPAAGRHNQYRGAPLSLRDAPTRAALARLSGLVDTDRLSALWSECLAAPAYEGRGLWLHGDLHAGNLIVRDGALSGVIDFGLCGIGDSAVDLIAAWSFFEAPARQAFRQALSCDAAEWRRGQGWALSTAAIALDYYRSSNPTLSGLSLRSLKELEAGA